jgi:hypothetical protein
VRVTEEDSVAGRYAAERGIWKPGVDPTLSYTDDTDADFTNAIPCWLVNQPEKNRTTPAHRIAAQIVVDAWDQGRTAQDGKPIYGTDYGKSIRRLRLKPDGTYLQVTTKDAEPLELNDDDWRDEIPLTKCTATSTEALMAAMA